MYVFFACIVLHPDNPSCYFSFTRFHWTDHPFGLGWILDTSMALFVWGSVVQATLFSSSYIFTFISIILSIHLFLFYSIFLLRTRAISSLLSISHYLSDSVLSIVFVHRHARSRYRGFVCALLVFCWWHWLYRLVGSVGTTTGLDWTEGLASTLWELIDNVYIYYELNLW